MNSELIYTGIQYLDIGKEEEVLLADGLKLVKPNSFLMSGRMRYAQNEREYEEAEKASHYLVYRYESRPLIDSKIRVLDPKSMFFGGLMALQIVEASQYFGLRLHRHRPRRNIHSCSDRALACNAGGRVGPPEALR